MKTGFFIMQDAVAVLKFPSLDAAQLYLKTKIATHVLEHPHVHAENIAKIHHLIDTTSSIEKLSIAIANWVLAHPSENLKVIRQ